jgi:hypothetical protein
MHPGTPLITLLFLDNVGIHHNDYGITRMPLGGLGFGGNESKQEI